MQVSIEPNVLNAYQHPNGTTVFIPKKTPGHQNTDPEIQIYALKLPTNCDLTKPILIAVESSSVTFGMCETVQQTTVSTLTNEPGSRYNHFPADDQLLIHQGNLIQPSLKNAEIPIGRSTDVLSLKATEKIMSPRAKPSSSSVPSTAFNIDTFSKNASSETTQFLNDILFSKSPCESKRSPGRPKGSYSHIKDIQQTDLGFKCSICDYLTHTRRKAVNHRRTKHYQT